MSKEMSDPVFPPLPLFSHPSFLEHLLSADYSKRRLSPIFLRYLTDDPTSRNVSFEGGPFLFKPTLQGPDPPLLSLCLFTPRLVFCFPKSCAAPLNPTRHIFAWLLSLSPFSFKTVFFSISTRSRQFLRIFNSPPPCRISLPFDPHCFHDL